MPEGVAIFIFHTPEIPAAFVVIQQLLNAHLGTGPLLHFQPDSMV